MSKFLCSLALFAAIGVLVASVSSPAPAQQKDKKDVKKDDKKDDKKDVKKEEKRDDSKIEVYQGKDGWRFRVVGPDGKSVAIGVQGYAKKEDCLAAVDVVKATLGKAKVVELPKD
jgi:uncharacterized protein YegP (UPF0339 family)